jgi:dihydrolipoamide dehydrogenase
VVEFLPELLVGADPDLVKPVVEHARTVLAGIRTQSKVVAVERTSAGYAVTVEEAGGRSTLEADEVLVSIGREPRTTDLGLDAAGVALLDRGLIRVDEACRTTNPRIFAIGDVTPGPMLAHKASREAKVAAEVIASHPSAFDNRAIPAVVFTDPEIAWVGLTEREATEASRPVTVGRFPMKALGRARTLARTEGLVKVIADPDSKRVLGVGIVSPMASDLIAEATLAIEMGATLEDLMVTIHPHPTLSEAVMEAAEVAAGMPVHLHPPLRR